MTKTHCRRGHEFTPENTTVHTDGHRRCRECQRTRDSRRSRSTMTPEERAAAKGAALKSLAERRRRDRADLVAEIEHQLEAGASAKLLPARLGYDKPTSLARRLYRAERPDLAAMFERAA